MIYFPGSTIGNFTPSAAIRLLQDMANAVGDGGSLLIGFDLKKNEEVLIPAYNDERGVTAAFNLNILTRINRELNADFDLEAFTHRAIYNRSADRIEMRLFSRQRQVVHISGSRFVFNEGESILTEHSHKYSLAQIARMTSEAGLTLIRQWTDSKNYFSVQYLEVSSHNSISWASA